MSERVILPPFRAHIEHIVRCYRRDHPLVVEIEIHVHPWLIPALREDATMGMTRREREAAEGQALVALWGQPIVPDPEIPYAGVCPRRARVYPPAILAQLHALPPPDPDAPRLVLPGRRA
jgi:hypothetical protein